MTKPKDFLQEARALLGGATTEIRRRTIVGRAYYAAYHFLLSHSCTDGFKAYRAEADTGRHKALIDFLSKSQDRVVQHCGRTLSTLFSRRRKADYILEKSISITEAKDTVELAEELIEGTLEELKAAKKGKSAS